MAGRRVTLRAVLVVTVLLATGCSSDGRGTGTAPVSKSSAPAVSRSAAPAVSRSSAPEVSKSSAPAVSKGVAPSSAAAGIPDPVATAFPAATVKALQAILSGAVDDHALTPLAGAPGITAAVVSDRGSWAGAAGRGGDGARLSPDAMMSVASITKTFVAAEVMQLAAMGKVDLDAPLSTYVRHPLTANGATVRQVLSMRSGLRDPPATVLEALVRARAGTQARNWTARDTLAYLRPRSSAPGATPVYANTNYLLLGMLIAKVTGRTVAQVERADLFNPAGLRRIAAQDTERPAPPLALPQRSLHPEPDGYLPSRGWARVGGSAFTGIAADAATVARWGYQLYGGRLLPAESVRAMTRQSSQVNLRPGVGYGLGTMVFSGLCTDPTYGHTGDDGRYAALLAVVPKRHLAVAVLIPQGGRDRDSVMRDILTALQ